jgi:hypothetical protein
MGSEPPSPGLWLGFFLPISHYVAAKILYNYNSTFKKLNITHVIKKMDSDLNNKTI